LELSEAEDTRLEREDELGCGQTRRRTSQQQSECVSRGFRYRAGSIERLGGWECGRVEYGADVESTDGEVCRARIQVDVTRKKKKGEEKRSTETECALASKEQKDCRLGRNAMGVLSASRGVQGRIELAHR